MGFTLTKNEDSSDCQEASEQRYAVGQFFTVGAIGVKCEAKACQGGFRIYRTGVQIMNV